mgnify:FL=1
MWVVSALVLAWLLIPEPLWAWGPGTHIALGELVLGSLYLLPPAVRALLEANPIHFLYGSVAADISFAKKYAPEGRHCHHWHVGEEIFEMAGSERLESMALGYLAHLAADTVAHNLYVPRQLLLTSTTASIGHTYWEHRMDVHVGEDYLSKAQRIVFGNDHSEADALFDEVLSSTLFSFRTNRRLFRGMIQVQGDDRWLQLFDRILRKSRFDVPDEMVQRYVALAYDSIIDYLRNRHLSAPAGLDPIGDVNLRLAKKVRRMALAKGASSEPELLDEMAEEFFPWPEAPLVHWPRMREEELRTEVRRVRGPSPSPAGHSGPGASSGPPDRNPR